MGTSYHILVIGPKINNDDIGSDVDELLEIINQQMSTYQDNSELLDINRAELNVWLPISKPLFEVLALSQDINGQSDGAFDVTVGPVVNLWGFGPDQHTEEVPHSELISATMDTIGADSFELDINTFAIKKHKAIYIDLSAIAKGYAVDKLAELLMSKGYYDYMVEIGGEIRVSGQNSRGESWRLAIEKPVSTIGKVFQTIAITNGGIATSGDYRNYFEIDGARYSHTIDPLTGYPVEHDLVSVTVIASSAIVADAWATALNVLGGKKGLAIAERKKLAAYFITNKDGELVAQHSQAFSPYLD
tara:strand:- start:293 stop:1201 length:909 start_codon:yes stop_codon:yes gene_type:complete